MRWLYLLPCSRERASEIDVSHEQHCLADIDTGWTPVSVGRSSTRYAPCCLFPSFVIPSAQVTTTAAYTPQSRRAQCAQRPITAPLQIEFKAARIRMSSSFADNMRPESTHAYVTSTLAPRSIFPFRRGNVALAPRTSVLQYSHRSNSPSISGCTFLPDADPRRSPAVGYHTLSASSSPGIPTRPRLAAGVTYCATSPLVSWVLVGLFCGTYRCSIEGSPASRRHSCVCLRKGESLYVRCGTITKILRENIRLHH
ncbi:uncharacterized protein C8Q71DRAFT_391208 [Rhodofomes roseus]|uniref:Uncharacterized protein n=1 Tax=Rhodofomes roseus TaxID=34475 RepID=A0ABQ8JZP0_9APHY|nr:uncharacterized protein C8Q71DRAFT_391208 [Rhodofomes roseus]KAH9829854.1 hypothetical protein C8Q71DRAFT_391208 [Rhodofomes roseus]